MQTAKEQVRHPARRCHAKRYSHTLSDSLYTLYVREQIELGMRDSRAGRVIVHADVKKRYLNGGR